MTSDILKTIVLPLVLAIFGSSGFWAYLQSKNDKSKKILDTIDEIKTSIKTLDKKINDIEASAAETEARNARNRIVRFADDIRVGKKASKDYYDHIMSDIDVYNDYCTEHPKFKNGIAVVSIEKINQHYSADDFL